MVVIFLWSFTAYLSFQMLGFERVLILNSYEGLVLFFFPLGGWVGDVYLGRYRVVKYSLRTLWVSLIACDLLIVVGNVYIAKAKVVQILTGIGAVASVAVWGNILHLGTDQLIDASSSEISSFINWQVWTFFLAGSIFLLSTSCFCGFYTDSIPLAIPAAVCTASVICDFFLSQWIVKEPVKINPVKQIYQVLKYAAQNKYPRLRSAFTYWDDKPYSRIDLGKSKYGGPFTTEQVEDVKTFFRILLVVILSLPLTCLVIAVLVISINKVYLQFDGNRSQVSCQASYLEKFYSFCYQNTAVQFFHIFFVILFVPVEKVLFRVMKCHLCYIGSIFQKFLLGEFFLLLYALLNFSLENIALQRSHDHNGTCLFNPFPQQQLLNLDLNWLLLPEAFLGISIFLMMTALNEFITAQAPYAMRGFLLGLWHSLAGCSFGLANVFVSRVDKATKAFVKTSSQASKCSIWYFGILSLVVFLLIISGFLVVKKCYTPRRRDEELHNNQKFAIEYFEKYISSHHSQN